MSLTTSPASRASSSDAGAAAAVPASLRNSRRLSALIGAKDSGMGEVYRARGRPPPFVMHCFSARPLVDAVGERQRLLRVSASSSEIACAHLTSEHLHVRSQLACG